MSAESLEGRFTRFIARPDVVDVTSRYSDWARSSEGIRMGLQLAMLAMQRVGGQVSRAAYRRAVRDFASTTTIPLGDFLILAKCHLELLRSGLTGSGRIAVKSSNWAYDRRGA